MFKDKVASRLNQRAKLFGSFYLDVSRHHCLVLVRADHHGGPASKVDHLQHLRHHVLQGLVDLHPILVLVIHMLLLIS